LLLINHLRLLVAISTHYPLCACGASTATAHTVRLGVDA